MSSTKVKIENLRTQFNRYLSENQKQNFSEKLKGLKAWTQVKSPKVLRPFLGYTLDWLSPELLGTGFNLLKTTDLEVKALIPAIYSNLDFSKEIHQGLVVNAIFEMSKTYIQKQIPHQIFQIVQSNCQIEKKLNWSNDLEINLVVTQSALDDFYIELQKNRISVLDFDIMITAASSSQKHKKNDTAHLKLKIQNVELIA